MRHKVATARLSLFLALGIAGPVVAQLQKSTTQVVPRASIELGCGGKRYAVATGSPSGRCTVESSGGVPSEVKCSDDQGNVSTASCAKGCELRAGSGTCSER